MREPIHAIRFPFAVDENLGRLAEEPDYVAHVEQLMRQVLLTDPGERINRPDFGCGIRRTLFTPNSEVAAGLAQVTIFQALDRWLGEVIRVDRVEVRPHEEVLDITIAYIIKADQKQRYLNLEVTL